MEDVGEIMDDEEIILRLEERIRELERGFSVWKGWKSSLIGSASVLIVLIGVVWSTAFSPLKDGLLDQERSIRAVQSTLITQRDTLTTIMTLTARDREMLRDIDKRLDEAFERINSIIPHLGD